MTGVSGAVCAAARRDSPEIRGRHAAHRGVASAAPPSPERTTTRPPFGVGYTRPTISSLHTRYASTVTAKRCVLSSGTSRIAGDRPVPHIVTELPGPKARAHVEFDETWTSPSLPRAYPIVPVRGDGLTVEDIDGNLFLDFAAGIAVNSTGHSHPQVVAAIKEQAAELIHFSASDFYLPIYPEVCREIARISPIKGRARVYLGNSGHRGRRGVDQARPLRDPPAVHRRLPRRVPRPDVRIGLADGLEGEVPRRLRAAPAGHLPRSVRQGRGPALVRRGPVRQARPGQRGGGDHRRADPGRGRLHRPRGRLPAGPARRSATSTASCSSPTRSSRAPAGPARCGRSTTGASSPTSC